MKLASPKTSEVFKGTSLLALFVCLFGCADIENAEIAKQIPNINSLDEISLKGIKFELEPCNSDPIDSRILTIFINKLTFRDYTFDFAEFGTHLEFSNAKLEDSIKFPDNIIYTLGPLYSTFTLIKSGVHDGAYYSAVISENGMPIITTNESSIESIKIALTGEVEEGYVVGSFKHCDALSAKSKLELEDALLLGQTISSSPENLGGSSGGSKSGSTGGTGNGGAFSQGGSLTGPPGFTLTD